MWREASRRLRQSPWYAGTVVLSVAIGAGLAGSTISVTHDARKQAVPYLDAKTLVEIWETEAPGDDSVHSYVQAPRAVRWAKTKLRHLTQIAGSSVEMQVGVLRAGDPIRASVSAVVGDWFDLLGIAPLEGRYITEEDHHPRSEASAVASHSFSETWLRGGIGATLDLGGTTFTIVGVMPASFEARHMLWVPQEKLPTSATPAAYSLVGRLQHEGDVDDARNEIEQLAAREVLYDSAQYGGLGATIRPIGHRSRHISRPVSQLVLVVAGVVLLLSLTNLVLMSLVRSHRRRSEFAVRACLGASRWGVVRASVTEAALASSLGVALGLVLTYWGKEVVRSLIGGEYQLPSAPTVGWQVMLSIVVIGGVATAALSLPPLRLATSAAPHRRLPSGQGRSLLPRRELWLARLVVAAQVAGSLVLLTAVGVTILASSVFRNLDLGYDPRAVVQAVPDYDVAKLDRTAQWRLADLLHDRLRQRPEVLHPVSWLIIGEDYPPNPDWDVVAEAGQDNLGVLDRVSGYYQVTHEFFRAMNIPILRGRPFLHSDNAGSPRVAVITNRGAQLLWPGGDALGRQVKLGRNAPWMTVVGIAEDLQPLDEIGRAAALRDRPPAPLLFVPKDQDQQLPEGWRMYPQRGQVALAARASGDTRDAAQALREEIEAIAPAIQIRSIGSVLDLHMAGAAARSITFAKRLVTAVASLAILLALLGVAGVTLEVSTRRLREVGVRLALGASDRQVIGGLVRESLASAVAGGVVGLFFLWTADQTVSTSIMGHYVGRAAGTDVSGAVVAAALALALLTTACALIVARVMVRAEPAALLRTD